MNTEVKPGNVEEVNDFLHSIGRHHLAPMVYCEQNGCTTLVCRSRRRTSIKSKITGQVTRKRLCNHHTGVARSKM